jgi:hypothetical protein
MLRVEVEGLPPVDVADAVWTIGSGPAARIRLPATVAREVHVRIEGDAWSEGDARGAIGAGHTFAIGEYRVRVAPAPDGVVATPPQRTESLARELVRGLLGTDGAPTLTIESGPHAGAKRTLAPPESVLVIGRGDEASWPIADDDLSRTHAEIRRTLDGTTIRDLGSKNGTRVNGKWLKSAKLRSGTVIELGNVVMRFDDPVEAPLPARTSLPPAFWLAALVFALAIGGLVWVLAS